MINSFQRTVSKLLDGMPAGKPYSKMRGGRSRRGIGSTHRTKQAVAYRRFLKMKMRVRHSATAWMLGV